MAYKFVYFVIAVVAYSVGSIESYYLNDDLDTNLPEGYGDPIDENWQDKRSTGDEYASFFRKVDSFPNFDYQKGNAETGVGDGMEMSETFGKFGSDDDGEVHQPLNEADIRKMMSQLSLKDREALDNLINDESPKIDVNKRQLLKQNFENNFHLNKRNKMSCSGLGCMSQEHISEGDGYNQCPPEKVNLKRKSKFKRSNNFHSTPHENILQAKISILKDNYKRSSEMRLLENSAMRKYNKNKKTLNNDEGDENVGK